LPFSGSIDFVGREDDLLELHLRLQGDRPLVISAIAGMGGIGKTELALHYAYERLPLYAGGICWLRSIETMAIDILLFAEQFHGVLPDQDSEGVQRVQDCWRKWPAESTLVVIDNAPSFAEIKAILPPVRSQFKVLLTSRSRFESPVDNYEIKVLSLEASIELLQRLLQDQRIDQERQRAEEICGYLGYLPLALELVGRYLARDHDLSLGGFWLKLQEEGIQSTALKLGQMNGLMTEELGVIAAFELSWQRLSSKAQRLAAFLSVFALADFTWDIVEKCLVEWNSQVLKDLRNQELCGSYLLDRKDDGVYALHQLLREFFALKFLELPEPEEFMGIFAREMTIIAKTILPVVVISEQVRLVKLAPHLARASNFANLLSNDDKISCCIGLGRLYQSLNQYSDAEFWLLRSLTISQEQLKENHPSIATSLNNLAELYRITGRQVEAEPLFVLALEIREKQLGANHPETASSLNNLAALYYSTDRYADIEALYLRSLEIKKQQLGEYHSSTAFSLNNLAVFYQSAGRYADAETLHLQSLAIIKKELGESHPDAASSINNLAELYRLMSRYKDAESLYVQSLEIREKQLGRNHQDTAASLNNLALLYESTGRYSEAEPLYLRSIQIAETTLGVDHPSTQIFRDNLALLRHNQNLATTKITWGQRVIKIIVWPFSFCYRSTRWLIRQIFKN
jgi:tetratricopeptide (TPR) repeat protein